MAAGELWACAENGSDVPPESLSVFSGSAPQVGTDWDLEGQGPCRSYGSRARDGLPCFSSLLLWRRPG